MLKKVKYTRTTIKEEEPTFNGIWLVPQTSLNEAQRLLGKNYKYLSDDQVREIVNVLTVIARETLEL
jgi:hypothetical protein